MNARWSTRRALPLLERARETLPDRTEVRYHYTTVLANAGRRTEVRQELAELLNEVESFPERERAERMLQDL